MNRAQSIDILNAPRVTVAMAVFNTAQFVRDAIASVLAQSYRDFELIIVDDASTDDSLAVVRSFDDPRIRVVEHLQNVGASASRNEALAIAKGEFVAIMDADDVCVPARLEKQVAFLDSHPGVGLVGCAIYDTIDERGRVLGTSHLPTENAAIQQELTNHWCFLHSSWMFRQSLYKELGGYRKEFEPVEDHDLALRMAEICEMRNFPESLVSYRLNRNSLSVTASARTAAATRAAIELAHTRRSKKIESAVPLTKLTRAREKGAHSIAARQFWSQFTYRAHRYYQVGLGELRAGRLDRARNCFKHSIRANIFHVKAWHGLLTSFGTRDIQ